MPENFLPGPATASYAFAAVGFAAFAARLAVGRRGGVKALLLLAAVTLSMAWASLDLAFALGGGRAFWTAQSACDALRVGCWLAFVWLLVGGNARQLVALGGATATAAAFLTQQPAPFTGDMLHEPVSRAPFALLLALAIVGLVATEQLYRRAGEAARWAVKPLCLALGGSFVFDLYVHADALLFGRLDADLWAARGFAQALVIPFVAVATARNKDWTIDIAFSRGVVLHSTAFLASGIYLLAVAAAGYYVRYFGGSWGKTVQAGFIFAALLVLAWFFSSGTLRSKLRVFINKNFFSYRYDYREEWLRFTNRLSVREPDIGPAQRSIEALANLVESPAGALWLREGEAAFTQAGRWNWAAPTEAVDAGSALPRFLEKSGWVVDLAEFRREPARYAGLAIPPWLAANADAWLVVPIIAQEEVIGFAILASPRTPIELNWEVLDLLKTAARQIGGFLAQIRASEALLEARKFEAFNKMAAFVVHDLKNLVAQLSLLLRNAERHGKNPLFQEDMLSTVKHVSERMNQLLLQLGSGARAEEPLRPVDLGVLARRVARAKGQAASAVAVEDSGNVLALGREQRCERIVGHLVQNAIDATRGGGEVSVRVFAEGQCAVLEVRDSGCGMDEAFVREQLFRPFQSTKPAGMGIGAFEASQYAKELGGRIEAESRRNVGTRIKLTLPLHRAPIENDASRKEAA